MIQSMTGFGRGEYTRGSRLIVAEIRAVNHRYGEVQVKLPKRYYAWEEKLRQHVSASLARGKIDLFIKVESVSQASKTDVGDSWDGVVSPGVETSVETGVETSMETGVETGEKTAVESTGVEIRIDMGLALQYHKRALALAEALGIEANLGVKDILALPGMVSIDEAAEEAEEVWSILVKPVDAAIANLVEMRKSEGSRLRADFHTRLDYLEKLRGFLLDFSPGVVENYRQKLASRIAELMGQQPVDETRLVQEVAIFADRASVDEELVRLDSHFQQFRELLDATEPVGRKLDFLCQEILREVNTTGGKANDLSMTKIVVEIKSELEKLREQVQNVQ